MAKGSSITVTEKFVPLTENADQFQAVLGFDPTVFSVSNFQMGNIFSSSTADKNTSPSSGIYDFGASSTAGSVSLTGGTAVSLFTFTLTALANAPTGNSDLFTLVNDGAGYSSRVSNGGTAVTPLNGLGTTYYSPVDLQINVTSAATPEPATAGLVLLAAGSLLAYRRKRQSR